MRIYRVSLRDGEIARDLTCTDLIQCSNRRDLIESSKSLQWDKSRRQETIWSILFDCSTDCWAIVHEVPANCRQASSNQSMGRTSISLQELCLQGRGHSMLESISSMRCVCRDGKRIDSPWAVSANLTRRDWSDRIESMISSRQRGEKSIQAMVRDS